MKDMIFTVEAKMPHIDKLEWTMLKRCPTLEDAKNYVEFQRLSGFTNEMKIVKMEIDLVTVETFPSVITKRSGG